MPDCFQGLVKIRNGGNVVSGIKYIDDLPGISQTFIELLTTENEETVSKLFEKVERRGIDNFINQVKGEYASPNKQGQYFTERALVSQVVTGEIRQPLELTTSEAYLSGYKIYLYQSDNLELNLESIQLYNSGVEANGSIYIYDIQQGKLLDTIAYTAGANQYTTVDIFKQYSGKIIFVGIDKSEIVSRKINGHGAGYYQQICQPCRGWITSGSSTKISKSEADIIDYNFLNEPDPGIIINYSINCSLTHFLCRQKSYLAQSLCYQLGLEFFVELVGSNRINPSTNISEKEYGIILNYFETGLNTGINNFVKSRPLQDSICTEGKGFAKRAIFKP